MSLADIHDHAKGARFGAFFRAVARVTQAFWHQI